MVARRRLSKTDSRWLLVDPDRRVAVKDLDGDEPVVVLRRNQLFPTAVRPIYAFGAKTAEEFETLGGLAAQRLALIGAGPAGGAGDHASIASWLFSDIAHPSFGQSVPVDLGGGHATGGRDSGLVLVPDADDDGEPEWTTMERVGNSDVDEWLSDKRAGAGADSRLIRYADETQRRRQLPLETVVRLGQASSPPSILCRGASPRRGDDCPRQQQPRAPAVCKSLARGRGHKVDHPVARERVFHVVTLHYLWSVDHLNGLCLATTEHVARRIVQIQRAVAADPSNPDFSGLDAYNRHYSGSMKGLIYAPKFDSFVAGEQRDHALFLKQSRMAREEETYVQARCRNR